MAVEQGLSFVPDLATIVRAGGATCVDAAGSLVEVGPNALRQDFDPLTGVYRGVRVEQAATNLARNPRWEGAAAPGTVPGQFWMFAASASGITREIVGVTVEDGLPCIDLRFYGTASALYDAPLRAPTPGQIAAVAGVSCTQSVYARVLSGSLTGVSFRQSILGLNSSNAQVEFSDTFFTPTSSPLRQQRFVATRTLSHAATVSAMPGIMIRIVSGATVDFVLRLAGLQIELTPVASSLILPPAGAPAVSSRAADVLTMADIGRWFGPAAGTFVLDFTPRDAAAPDRRGLLAIDDGTSANRMDVYLLDSSAGVLMDVARAGATMVNGLFAGVASVLARNTLRFSYGPAGYFVSLNGAVPISMAAGLPGGLTHVRLGQRHVGAAGQELNGWLGPRLAYYPVQYTDTPAADGFTIRTR